MHGHALSQLVHRSSLLGETQLGRLRSAALGMLGLVTAIGLGLIAFVLQQGWPSVFGGPLPDLPGEHPRMERATLAPAVLSEHRAPARRAGAATAGVSPASEHRGGRVDDGSHVSDARHVTVSTPSAPDSAGSAPTAEPGPPAPPVDAPTAETTSPASSPPAAVPTPPATPPTSPGRGKGNGKGKAIGHEKSSSKAAAAPPAQLEVPAEDGETGQSDPTPEDEGHPGKGHAYGKYK